MCEMGVLDWKLWFVEPFNVLASTAPQGFTISLSLVVKVNTPLPYTTRPFFAMSVSQARVLNGS